MALRMIAQIISTCTRLHPPLTDKSCWFAEGVWSGDAMAIYIGSEPQENRLEGKHLVIRAAMEVAMAPSQHSNSSKCAWGRVAHVVSILLASVTMTLATPAVAHGSLLIRTASKLYRISKRAPTRQP